jgi:tyrosyl-tRNA synthetase
VDDRDVGVHLRWFTLFDRDTIESLESALAAHPEARTAQRALARDLTERVHGADAAAEVERVSAILFGGDPVSADEATLSAVSREIPTAPWPGAGPHAVVDLAIAAGAAASRGDARRLLAQGGLAVNGVTVREVDAMLGEGDLISGRYLLVRRGKRDYRMLLRG